MDDLLPSELTFVVVPGNPYDTTVDDLSPLLDELNAEGRAEVRIRPERGYGVTFIEVVIIYIAMKVLDATVDRIIERTLDKAEAAGTQWWKRRRLEKARRPATVLICDEDGNVLRSIEYRPEDEPTRADVKQAAKRLPMPPPEDQKP